MSAEHSFGVGGDEPYRLALAPQTAGGITLRRTDGGSDSIRLDVDDWRREATDADGSALDGATAPVLDVGCGPGRMVRAAAARALPALGIDVLAEAIALTSADGTPALLRSVFDRLPLEGRWGTVLLIDGNVGIGGDPESLLRRCRALLEPGGSVVIEVADEPYLLDHALYTAVLDSGHESAPFPWARVGRLAIDAVAHAAGLSVTDRWRADGRHFVRAERSPSAVLSAG